MRHRNTGRQLGRNTHHRRALFRNLVTSLLDCERIETTEAKAKEVRGFAERMISLGKQGGLPARRRALAFLRSKEVVSKLFDDVALRFRDRQGGYTRLIKTRRRVGDAAEMVAIELVTRQGPPGQSKAKAPGETKAGRPESEKTAKSTA